MANLSYKFLREADVIIVIKPVWNDDPEQVDYQVVEAWLVVLQELDQLVLVKLLICLVTIGCWSYAFASYSTGVFIW